MLPTNRGQVNERSVQTARTLAQLLGLAPLLLAIALAREGLLRPALVARLQVEGVLLDVLDDVFLLHLPFETAERAFNGLAFLNLYFCQGNTPPSSSRYVHGGQ